MKKRDAYTLKIDEYDPGVPSLVDVVLYVDGDGYQLNEYLEFLKLRFITDPSSGDTQMDFSWEREVEQKAGIIISPWHHPILPPNWYY